jgi:cytochrome c peroxidase
MEPRCEPPGTQARGVEVISRGRLFPTSIKLRHAFKTPTLRDVARRALNA